VTAVEGEWLAELGPMFFTVKESYKTRIAQREFERIERSSMEAEFEAAKQKSQQMQQPALPRRPSGSGSGYSTIGTGAEVGKRAVTNVGVYSSVIPKRKRIGL
jgi:hypothetical protein